MRLHSTTTSSEPGNAWETMVWRKKEMRSHNVLFTCRELNYTYSSKCRADSRHKVTTTCCQELIMKRKKQTCNSADFHAMYVTACLATLKLAALCPRAAATCSVTRKNSVLASMHRKFTCIHAFKLSIKKLNILKGNVERINKLG